MSSMMFSAKLEVDVSHKVRAFYKAFSEFKNTDKHNGGKVFEELKAHGLDNDFADLLARQSITWTESEKKIDMEMESSSEVNIEFYDKLIEFFDREGVEKYHARLFDTSSGGVQVWDKPEMDLDLNKAKVYLLGDFDDEDDLQENLEGMGSNITNSIDECDLVVVGENADINLFKKANVRCPAIILENDIWDYFI